MTVCTAACSNGSSNNCVCAAACTDGSSDDNMYNSWY